MPQYTINRKDHAREIAVCVSHEYVGRIFVVEEQSQGHSNEGEEQVDAEEVTVRCRMWVCCEGREVEDVVDEDEESDYEGLENFKAIYAGEDVDAVGAENSEGGHVGVVHPSCACMLAL